jgi:hypothetical protein
MPGGACAVNWGEVSGRFFVKKLRKKLLPWVPGDIATSRVKVTKVFCGAFLQKSDLFLESLSCVDFSLRHPISRYKA